MESCHAPPAADMRMGRTSDLSNSSKRLFQITSGIIEYLDDQKEQGIIFTDRSVTRPSETPTGLQPSTGLSPAVSAQSQHIETTRSETERGLLEIARRVAGCSTCHLCKQRTRTVPGQGSSTPEIMFVGEGPGADEDRQGLAFVGKAGKLLTQMIEAMGLTREEVFIGNIVKCRPPGNRAPTQDEMDACLHYLRDQIRLLRPRVIVALGATAVRGLLDTKLGITKLRGTWMQFEGIDLMPTFHPAYLLRDASKKKYAWEDLQSVLRHIGREAPPTSH